MLDEHRAALDAPAAGRALPDRFFGDGVVDERQAERLERALAGEAERGIRGLDPVAVAAARCPLRRCRGRQRGLGQHDLVAQTLHEVLRAQRLAGHRGGAELHAAAALGAAHRVEKVAPGEVLQALGAEDRLLTVRIGLRFEVHRAQRAARLQVAEVDVRLAGEDVEVLAVRQVRAEAQHEQDVRPAEDPVAGNAGVRTDAGQQRGERPGKERKGS